MNWGKKWLVHFSAGKTQLVLFHWSNSNGSIDVKMNAVCNLRLAQWFGRPKCFSVGVKFPYVCLVARQGEQLLEKQILKINLDSLS